jgi:hypothetical protein
MGSRHEKTLIKRGTSFKSVVTFSRPGIEKRILLNKNESIPKKTIRMISLTMGCLCVD